jgi:hypothetical protein
MIASVGESYGSVIPGRPDVDVADLDADRQREAAPTLDISDIDGLELVYRIRGDLVELRLSEGRELRIAVMQDLRTGEYRAEYERRTTVRNLDGAPCHVWTTTSLYDPMVSADPETCLRRALEDVTRLHVY